MTHELLNDHADLNTAITLLDKWLALQVHDKHLPGMAIGLVHNGDLLWGKGYGYGYASIENQIPITLDTRFRIASITKTFTALAILQLHDAEKLSIHDPIAKYLSWFDLSYPDAPPITIYHCLTHTAGLPRDATVPHWTENQFQSWEDVVKTTQSRELLFPPLQHHSYSNLGYTLLGGVIEAVTNQSWAEVMQANLDTLGMTETVPTPDSTIDNLATGYLAPDDTYQRHPVNFIETKGFSPSASFASSVNDLVKYAKFHLSKGQTPLLSGYSLREMHRVHWVNEDWQGGYGLGTRTWRMGEYVVSGHTGGYKGFTTIFSVCREHDFGVILLTNSIDSTPRIYAKRAYEMVLPELLKITRKTQQANPIWQDYVGSYLNDWGNFEIVVRHGKLQAIWLHAIDDAPMILDPTDVADTFIINLPNNPGETARFMRDDTGAVIRFYSRNEYSDKA